MSALARRRGRRRRSSASTRAAGDFFLEGLSTFEMVQRGFARGPAGRPARTPPDRAVAAAVDASSPTPRSPSTPSDSLEEMLRLVAEQARELVGRRLLRGHGGAGRPAADAEGASYAEDDRRWTAFVRWLDLPAIYRAASATSGGSARIGGEQLAELPPFRSSAGEPPLRGWLAASLTALDGSELGADPALRQARRGPFTGDDEAALVHLAQMASAAVERAQLYRG